MKCQRGGGNVSKIGGFFKVLFLIEKICRGRPCGCPYWARQYRAPTHLWAVREPPLQVKSIGQGQALPLRIQGSIRELPNG